MRWIAPPDRREIALILICIGTYLVAYNIEITLQALGIDAAATKGAVLSRLGVASTAIGDDGLKPAGWRDSLELEIYGGWQWLRGYVAGDGTERSQTTGSGRHGAQWVPLKDVEDVRGIQKPFGDSTVDDALLKWGNEPPQTHMLRHSPGYTILDNVYLLNDTVYLVTDSASRMPPISTIVASTGAGYKEWKVLSVAEGRATFGSYGSTVRGISWMHADTTPDNSTLFALWRTHSSLTDETDPDELPLPRRLIFPHNSFFTDPDADPLLLDPPARRRIDTGFHPYTAKAAFPFLTVMYQPDWHDYQDMSVPFVFERLVIADRTAALKYTEDGEPSLTAALLLEAPDNWWQPIQKNLAEYLGEYEVQRKAKKGITYLHTQGTSGPTLNGDDHDTLVAALEKFGHKNGYDIHVVSADTAQTNWTTRMTAVATSSVVIGAHGNHLMDATFMRQSHQSTLIELFPENTFVRDRELAVHSIGIHYRGLWGTKEVNKNQSAVSPQKYEAPVPIDVDTIIHATQEALSRSPVESTVTPQNLH